MNVEKVGDAFVFSEVEKKVPQRAPVDGPGCLRQMRDIHGLFQRLGQMGKRRWKLEGLSTGSNRAGQFLRAKLAVAHLKAKIGPSSGEDHPGARLRKLFSVCTFQSFVAEVVPELRR